MTDEEKKLLTLCFAGDGVSWNEFTRRYSGLIYRTIKINIERHRREALPDLVDDLFQEIFLTLVSNDFRQLRAFRGDRGCTLASWLRMIAARRTIDHMRKFQPPTEVLTDKYANPSSDHVLDTTDCKVRKALIQAVENLPPREKMFVKLTFYRNLPAQDVAAIFNMTVEAVYTLKSRILAKLRESLKK